ncbi:MAG TPA: hypothetical protein VFR47_15985 [Anaerolineales bacterium]|nr:hypothetical protein [Anaerolineales bacterium]
MTRKYEPLERYLRGLPVSQEDVTLTFTFIEQILNMPCWRPRNRRMAGGETRSRAPTPRWNPLPGWMPAGWPVGIIDLREKTIETAQFVFHHSINFHRAGSNCTLIQSSMPRVHGMRVMVSTPCDFVSVPRLSPRLM